jgi:hypothetical protein
VAAKRSMDEHRGIATEVADKRECNLGTICRYSAICDANPCLDCQMSQDARSSPPHCSGLSRQGMSGILEGGVGHWETDGTCLMCVKL